MLEKNYPLIEALADGQFHSGESLAQQFSISRTGIWKRVKQIDGVAGLNIQAVRGRGYRLEGGLELLQKSQLLVEVEASLLQQLDMLQILSTTTSTNDYLRGQLATQPGHGSACFAEYQTAGKGRRGRSWVSTYGRHLVFSLSWAFSLPMSQLSGLSIALGTVIAELLLDLGLDNIALKWPNDLHVNGQKLAGILVEASGEVDGPTQAIIGVGINLSSKLDVEIDQAWTALDKEMLHPPSRNHLAGQLLNTLLKVCNDYALSGLSPFLDRWRRFDRYTGKQVTLLSPGGSQMGLYHGLDDSGGVILIIDGEKQVFHAGEISLRLRE